MAANGFHAFVQELFAGMGAITIKRMFGGAGGYAGGLMFLLLDDETIYIKADDVLKQELRDAGSSPFQWAPKGGPRAGEIIDMGYWRLPEDALDDPDLAARWGEKALAVAKAKAKAKPAKKAGARKRASKRS